MINKCIINGVISIAIAVTCSGTEEPPALENLHSASVIVEKTFFLAPVRREFYSGVSGFEGETGKKVKDINVEIFRAGKELVALDENFKFALTDASKNTHNQPVGRLAASGVILFDAEKKPLSIVLRIAGSDGLVTFAPVTQRDGVIFQVSDDAKWGFVCVGKKAVLIIDQLTKNNDTSGQSEAEKK